MNNKNLFRAWVTWLPVGLSATATIAIAGLVAAAAHSIAPKTALFIIAGAIAMSGLLLPLVLAQRFGERRPEAIEPFPPGEGLLFPLRYWSPPRQAAYIAFLWPLRALALWLIAPIAFLVWAINLVVKMLKGQRPHKFRSYLTWLDRWFVTMLNRSLLRAFGAPRDRPPAPSQISDQERTRLWDAL